MREITLLCLFDYKANTGFATVSKNLIAELKKTFKGRIKFHICAINYFDDPYDEDENVFVFSAIKSAPKKDDFGRFGFLKILKESDEYDGIIIMQDLGVIVPIIEILDSIQKDKKKNNRRNFKSMFYFPVDCKVIPALVKGIEFFDCLITYTDYARNEVLRVRPELKGKLKVIYHGINTKHFYPKKGNDLESFRKVFFGEHNYNKYIISNINRNQPRKDIPTTIFAFQEAKKIWQSHLPKPFLYLHMNPEDPMGWDIRAIMLQTDLVEDEDYKLTPKAIENHGADVEMVNNIYNSTDAFITTTLGEGWGFCLHPSTEVYTRNGSKSISHVVKGDEVLSNDGLFHEVVDTTNREVEWMIDVKTQYGYDVCATAEHPYYSLDDKKSEIKYRRISELKVGDYLSIVKPIGNKKLPERIDILDYIDKSSVIVEGDKLYLKFGFSPKNTEWSYKNISSKYNTTKSIYEDARAYISGKKINVSDSVKLLSERLIKDGYQNIFQNKISRYIDIDYDFLYILGLYLADGNASGGARVEFNLNTTTKKDNVEFLLNYFNSKFNIQGTSRIRGKRYDVRFCSKIASQLFSNLCGNKAKNKSIPSFLIGSEFYLTPLVAGYIRGDGHVNYSINCVSYSTISKSLFYQIKSILNAHGIIITKKINPKYNLLTGNISHHHLNRYYELMDFGNERIYKSRIHRPDFVETDTHFFVKIKSIRQIKGKQTVYDLCVKDAHSFVANGLVCHNTVTESFATGTPVITPYNTSLIEIGGYNSERVWHLHTQIPYCNTIDNVVREQSDYVEVAETMLHLATIDDSDEKYKKLERAYNWITQYTWDKIADRWAEYIKETFF